MKLLVIFVIFLLAAYTCDARNENKRRRKRRRGGGGKGLDPDVQTLVDTIWKLDKRAKSGEDYQLCYQGKIEKSGDQAPNPLFCKMKPDVFNGPTFKAFIALTDNYNRVQGQQENITTEEIAENNHFLDLVIKSDIMQAVYALLVKKRRASTRPTKFRNKLYRLWFGQYNRVSIKSTLDSSGFEHVFIGETNPYKHIVGGFHNWIRLYNEEHGGHLNYLGYIKKATNPFLFNFRFSWYDSLKSIGSSFFGTSPEFEMSLYTAIYMMGYNHAKITIDGTNVYITCWPTNHNKNIGTCYPSL